MLSRCRIKKKVTDASRFYYIVKPNITILHEIVYVPIIFIFNFPKYPVYGSCIGISSEINNPSWRKVKVKSPKVEKSHKVPEALETFKIVKAPSCIS